MSLDFSWFFELSAKCRGLLAVFDCPNHKQCCRADWRSVWGAGCSDWMDKLDELGMSVDSLWQFNCDEMTRMILPDCQSLYSDAVEVDTHPAERGFRMVEVQGLAAKEQG